MPNSSRRSCISKELRSRPASLNLVQQQVESLNAQRISAEANVTQAKAQFGQAQVNLECTRIASPVDGLLAQLGDFVTKEQNS